MSDGVSVHLSLFGDDQILGELRGNVDRMGDASPWFSMIRGWLEREIGKQFATEGSHFHAKWQELSPAYAAQKKADGFGSRGILERTGALRRALTQGGGDAIRHISAHLMVFGAAVMASDGTTNIGAVHQHGTKDGRIPARKMLNLGAQRQDQTSLQLRRSLMLYLRTGDIRSPAAMHGGVGGGGR